MIAGSELCHQWQIRAQGSFRSQARLAGQLLAPRHGAYFRHKTVSHKSVRPAYLDCPHLHQLQMNS